MNNIVKDWGKYMDNESPLHANSAVSSLNDKHNEIIIPMDEYQEQKEEDDNNIELIEETFLKNYYEIEYEYNFEKKSINLNNVAFILQEFRGNNNRYFIIKIDDDTLFTSFNKPLNNVQGTSLISNQHATLINTKIQYHKNLKVNPIH